MNADGLGRAEMIVIARSAKRSVAIQLDCSSARKAGLLAMTEFEYTPY
jgi:hypothetical protein